MTRTAFRLAFLVTLAVTLLAPSGADAAPPTVIDFEDQPAETALADQYLGSRGVRFGDGARFGVPSGNGCGGGSGGGAVVAGGLSGARSAEISCGSGEFERGVDFAFEFATERKDVRFRLRRRGANAGSPTVSVAFYAVGGSLLERRTVALPNSFAIDVQITRPQADGGVAFVVVSGALFSKDVAGSVNNPAEDGLFLDDIVASLDDVPPPKKYTLALSRPSAEIIEGSTASAPVTVLRYNGSTAPVTLSVGALPPGIQAAQIDPNPVTGLNPSQLRITADRPLSGDRQVSVTANGSAAAGTFVGGGRVQTVRGVPALSFATGRFPTSLVPACGRSILDSFEVRGGYSGPVDIEMRVLSGPARIAFNSDRVDARGDGTTAFAYQLEQALGTSGPSELEVTLRPERATPVTLKLVTQSDAVRIDRVLPRFPTRAESVAGPLTQRLGPTPVIAVEGNFPPGCNLTFKDTLGRDYPVTGRDWVRTDDDELTQVIRLRLSPDATSTTIRALGPASVELARTPRIEVGAFRNTFALSQANAGPGAGAPDYTWGDFVRTFGNDDAEACFVFCIRDPIAVRYWTQYRASVQAYSGLCAGWAIMALRFMGFAGAQQSARDYSSTARRPWEIEALGDGSAAKRDIVRWQVAQTDKPFSDHATARRGRPVAEMRQRLQAILGEADAAYISIRQGNAGHAVVAYDVRNLPNGAFAIQIYDPNIPYTTGEETSAATQTANATQSVITVDAAGNWSGTSLGWTGNMSTFALVEQLPREDAALPGNLSLASLVNQSSAAPADATVSSIRAGGKEVLRPDGTAAPGSGVELDPVPTGVRPAPRYKLAPGKTYELAVRGGAAGRYTYDLLGGGVAVGVRGAQTAPGQKDTISVRPGRAEVGFANAAPRTTVTYDLAARVGGGRAARAKGPATRTATVQIDARRGGEDTTALARDVLSLRHDGPPTSASVTLASVGEGVPGAVTTQPLKIGRGERLELRPSSWRDLGLGVQLTVRDRSGRIVRRGAARLRAARSVALSGLRARVRSGRITASGRVTRRGASPVLVLAAELMHGKRVIARKTVSRRGDEIRAGSFSIPILLRRAIRGTRVRLTATLLDEAAGYASTRRQVTVRGR